MEGLCQRFLWNGKDGGRNNPERWEVVTLPVEEGGLGVKEILAWNKATLFKLIVDIAERRPCMWVRWVEANYERGGSFWSIASKARDPL